MSSGAKLPAACSIQASALETSPETSPETAPKTACEPPAARACSGPCRVFNAPHTKSVVLMLLKLLTVSPQPPSEFWFSINQSLPRTIRSRIVSRMRASRLWQSQRWASNAQTAVAVESALLDSSPSQYPWALRASNSDRRALAKRASKDVGCSGHCDSRTGSFIALPKTQVPEAQESIIGVFDVQRIVLPAPDKTTASGP